MERRVRNKQVKPVVLKPVEPEDRPKDKPQFDPEKPVYRPVYVYPIIRRRWSE